MNQSNTFEGSKEVEELEIGNLGKNNQVQRQRYCLRLESGIGLLW